MLLLGPSRPDLCKSHFLWKPLFEVGCQVNGEAFQPVGLPVDNLPLKVPTPTLASLPMELSVSDAVMSISQYLLHKTLSSSSLATHLGIIHKQAKKNYKKIHSSAYFLIFLTFFTKSWGGYPRQHITFFRIISEFFPEFFLFLSTSIFYSNFLFLSFLK